MRKFHLSPHTLSIFLECPRCFWFHMIKGQEFKRPSGPFPSLPSGMDNIIKKYFDSYRLKDALPPEISHNTQGKLLENSLINKWRDWRTGLEFIDEGGNKLFGALDECLVRDGAHIPIDYKTRGFALKEDSHTYYIFQMSCYNLLLHKNGYKVSNEAYLVFYVPSRFENEGVVRFNIEVRKVKTKPLEDIYRIFKNALGVLSLKEPPTASDCKYCNWALKVVPKDKSQLKLF